MRGGARLDSARNNFSNGEFEKVQADEKSDNLELLMGAHAAFESKDYERSDMLFETFNARDINPTGGSITSEIGKLAGGQMVGEYKPYMMDILFVSYFQLLDALAMERHADARVIINQSYSAQQSMSIEYKNLIENRSANLLPAELKSDNAHWNTYSDIMNPALTYLSGLYFLNAGEFENARQYLVRANGMMPNNTHIKSDLAAAENRIAQNNTAWIIIESGLAPRLTDLSINLPWMVGNKIQVISVSVSRPELYPVTAGQISGAQILADVDTMFMTEYNEYSVNDALRALAKTTANIAMQSAAADKAGGIGGILGAIYSISTTNAEIRSWGTLPKQIHLMKIKKNKSGLINFGTSGTINIDHHGNHLIHIRGNNAKIIRLK